jgi:Tol biopolymer transport system component
MKRLLGLAGFCTVVAVLVLPAGGSARVPGPNGQIAFFRNISPLDVGSSTTYAINPDGTAKQVLATETLRPHWSPDGSEVAMGCDSCGGIALIVDPDTGASRVLPPYPGLDIGCFWAWSPDGSRIACEMDTDDPSLQGLYTVRSSDGGDLTKVTSIPGTPGDYSPDGMSLSFVTGFPDDVNSIYVIKLDGTGLTQITPDGMEVADENGGSWSPTGNQILFAARSDPDHRVSLWVVNPDGSGLHQLPIPSCGGAFSDHRSHGCYDPTWSPDGTKIVFVRSSVEGNARQSNIYTVNADGTGLFQVTHDGFPYNGPDWGTHPPTG